MTHSHVSTRYLLKQLESDPSKRSNRDIRPDWLTELLEQAAELFEPLAEVGRVGFDCQVDPQGWSAVLYLGAVELVGGPEDGRSRQLGFHFDLNALLSRFDRIDDVSWTVCTPRDSCPSAFGQGAAPLSGAPSPPGGGPGIDDLTAGEADYGDHPPVKSPSLLRIAGTYRNHSVRLAVRSAPPDRVGPGLRQLPDGTLEPI